MGLIVQLIYRIAEEEENAKKKKNDILFLKSQMGLIVQLIYRIAEEEENAKKATLVSKHRIERSPNV